MNNASHLDDRNTTACDCHRNCSKVRLSKSKPTEEALPKWLKQIQCAGWLVHYSSNSVVCVREDYIYPFQRFPAYFLLPSLGSRDGSSRSLYPRIASGSWAEKTLVSETCKGKRARRHFSQLSELERGLIIGIKTACWSTRHVSGQVHRLECAVRNCWEQWTREGTHARKTESGTTRKTTRGEDRRIVWQALVDPTVTRSTIRADVGVAIVPQTISRYLSEANLKYKRPFRALPLTPEHQQLHLQWCQARSMWNVTGWQKVVFSDESRFVLGTDDNRVRVWRRPGEQCNSPHTVLRHTARTAGVMVWGVIAYDSRSTLIVMRGTLTGQRYVDDILRLHEESFLNGLLGAIFMQVNARPHTVRVDQDFLRHFETLPWPARSPDLSPVEHM
ncbi:transposable element Tc1 transposase [Trichonephila clavipes]|nr:transposable element Tc1 transposase [Trichonephila clavipes]